MLTLDTPITELVWNCEKFNMEVKDYLFCFKFFYNSNQERDDTSNPFVDNKFNARFIIILTILILTIIILTILIIIIGK